MFDLQTPAGAHGVACVPTAHHGRTVREEVAEGALPEKRLPAGCGGKDSLAGLVRYGNVARLDREGLLRGNRMPKATNQRNNEGHGRNQRG